MAIAIVSAGCAASDDEGAVQGRLPGGSCERCTIQLEKVGTIDGADDEHGFPGQPSALAMDVRGRVWVSFYADHAPVIYERTGEQYRTVARLGAGPGEVGSAALALRGAADTMLVYDSRHRRLHMHDADGAYLSTRTYKAPTWGQLYRLSDGRFLTAGRAPSLKARAFPLWVFDTAGALVTSLPPKAEESEPLVEGPLMIVAPLRAGGFWAFERFRLTTSVYSADLSLDTTFSRSVEWFRPSTSPLSPHPERTPQSQVVSAYDDGAGRLWVMATIPDPRWRSSFGLPSVQQLPMLLGGQRLRRPVADVERYADTVIEVYDIATRTLLVSWRTDLLLGQFLSDNIAVGYSDDGLELQLYRFSLAGG